MGSSRTQRYSILGDPVTRLEAICASARAGQLMIDEETYQAVHKYFTAEEAQAIEQPDGIVRCFEVLGAFEAHPERPWSYLG
jgi:class 3 adenylate cyclase